MWDASQKQFSMQKRIAKFEKRFSDSNGKTKWWRVALVGLVGVFVFVALAGGSPGVFLTLAYVCSILFWVGIIGWIIQLIG
jgi:hypothetical protein